MRTWQAYVLTLTLAWQPATGLSEGSAPEPGDWPRYARDLAGTRYSPLTQIDTGNVSRLERAWSFRVRPEGGGSIVSSATPIVIDVEAVDALSRDHGVTVEVPLGGLPGFDLRFIWLNDPDGVTNYFAQPGARNE